MTTTSTPGRVAEIFADARLVHSQSIERLEAGDIRDAAEKAWCATKRATDALVLARTGEEPAQHPRRDRGPLGAGQTVRRLRNAGGSLLHPDQLPPRHLLLLRFVWTRRRTPHPRNFRVHRRRREIGGNVSAHSSRRPAPEAPSQPIFRSGVKAGTPFKRRFRYSTG